MPSGEEDQGLASRQSPVERQEARTDWPPETPGPVSLARISSVPAPQGSASAEDLQRFMSPVRDSSVALMETQMDGVALMPTQTDIPVRSPVPSLQAPARTLMPVPPPPPVKPAPVVPPAPEPMAMGGAFSERVKAFVRETVEDALNSARNEIRDAITEALQPVKDRIAGLEERLGQMSDRMDTAGKKDDAHDGELEGLRKGLKDMEQTLAEVGADAGLAQRAADAVSERLDHELSGL